MFRYRRATPMRPFVVTQVFMTLPEKYLVTASIRPVNPAVDFSISEKVKYHVPG
jgi:hypothetical protein